MHVLNRAQECSPRFLMIGCESTFLGRLVNCQAFSPALSILDLASELVYARIIPEP